MTTELGAAKHNGPGKSDDFESWLAERHKWLQTAARRIIDSKAHPSDAEILDLGKLCIGEAGGSGEHTFLAVVPGSIVQAAVRPNLHINGLSDVRGVNKIKDRAFLNFGDGNLTVVYGANGSGKTGFSRILKQACGSRVKEIIYPNVFDKVTLPAEAKISVSVDDKKEVLDWSLAGGPLQALRHIHVFDSKTAANYIAAHNEVHYAPSRMRFVSSLIKSCDRVADHLTAQKQALVKKLPQVPAEFSQTKAAKWLWLVRSTTEQAAIEEACNYTDDLDKERVSAEGALAQRDIAGRLAIISRERANVFQITTSAELLKQKLSDEELGALIAARADALTKRTTAKDAAENVFSNAPLEGVGRETWMALWDQARKFSQAHAYPARPFPYLDDDSRCVLCQQPFAADAKARMGHFDTFVIGGLEAAAKTAEKACADLLMALPALPTPDSWALQASIVKLEEGQASTLLAGIAARSTSARISTKVDELPLVNWACFDDAAKKVNEGLTAEEKALKDLQQDGKRKELEVRVLELRAKQWLQQNKTAVQNEVERLTDLALLDRAIGLTNTSILTRKNNDLARDELHKGYQQRFSEELKALGGKRLPVTPDSKEQGKGKVTFGLTLLGAERAIAAEHVLSEGEMRVVALAAFLADISGSGNPTPFIFDDPISSLDQDFEEKVVKRLIGLTKTRQVIVFTHRLSLLALMEAEVKKFKDAADVAKLPPPIALHVASVCSFGKNTGVTQEISLRDLKPKSAINRLRNEQVPQLRKLHDLGEVGAYEERATGICADFRILVERCVESVLCNDVLVRFRRTVQTQGKITALAKITPDDCAFIDNLMTRYSVFEHSQSDEFPATRPDIDEIEADVTTLSTWIEDFSKRAVA